MDISRISDILKRTYPMLLLDGVTAITPRVMCHAFKNLSYNEWFFPSHFPEQPMMPGTLQLEAFTQAVALPLLMNEGINKASQIPILLAGIEKVRFYRPVVPGDRLDISVHIERIVLGVATASVSGSVNKETVSECKITYRLIDESN